ncbi:DUF6318 family protein [Aeromicrobium sp. Leaf289]|uniref:DUF6318 family protein n=1 Tax=Aeromicrobium sp. Leaf289 TaxID=1736324 RepID=UPI001F214250|nr:DUF6318 family protein [Aeromicrobium sp. Leaf289]
MSHRSWGQRSSRPRAISLGSDRQIGGSTLSVITRTAAIAALLLASACSGQPEVLEPDPRATAAPSSSSSPPPISGQASEATPEGAVAFANSWVASLNYAMETGDTTQLSDMSSDGCGGCDSYIGKVDGIYGAGGRLTGGGWSASDFEVEVKQSRAIVYFKASWDEGKFTEERGAAERVSPSGSDQLFLELGFADTKWEALALERTAD